MTLWPRTPAEVAAGVTPATDAYPPGDVRRQGMTDDSKTDFTTEFQAVINAAAGTVPVIVPRITGGYYKLTARITVPANSTIILRDGAELRWAATTGNGGAFQGKPSRPGLEIQGNSFVMQGRGKITGPSAAAYVHLESALMGFGASRTAPYVGFSVAGEIEFTQWGWGAIFIQFFARVQVLNTHVHDVGYIGMGFASCANGRVQRNLVETVTPGAAGRAYGITCTHDSAKYSSDPNAGTPQAANPFCSDFDVGYNVVANVPLWEGIDAHGAYETHFHDNKIYNCCNAISLAGSSGDAANYAGWNNSVTDNLCTTLGRDGSATTVSATPRTGIGISGGSTVPHRGVVVERNTVDGYGDTVVSSHSIQAKRCIQAQINANTITNWKGYAVYTAYGAGVIERNVFHAVANATNSTCINLDTTNGTWSVIENKHLPESGIPAAEGLRINNASNPRCLVKGNDFSRATSPYIANADGLHTWGDSYPTPALLVAGSPTTIDVSAVGPAPLVDIKLAVSGDSTVSDIIGVTVGQNLRITQTSAFTTTFDQTHLALPGSSRVALTQNKVLQLHCIAPAGTKFVAMDATPTDR